MLARRRYQRRYSIQKFAGTQPQFYTSLLPAPVPRQRRPWQPVAHLRPPRQPIPGAHRKTSGAHNSATAAPARLDPARQPARPHALKNHHYDPTPAFPPPSRYSISRAAQTAPAPAAALTPAPAPHKLHPPAPRETPAPTAPAPPPHPARTGADAHAGIPRLPDTITRENCSRSEPTPPRSTTDRRQRAPRRWSAAGSRSGAARRWPPPARCSGSGPGRRTRAASGR